MKCYNFLCIYVPLLLSQTLCAQHTLPPVWGQENAQYESRAIAYISPKRIVWKDVPDDASVSGLDNLLQPGIGQAVLSGGNLCSIKNGKTGRVSFLLDFGRELQGGIQFVTGM